MVTFQAQGWGEGGLVLSPIRELARLLSESPFYLVPQNRTLEGVWALAGKKIFNLLGKLEPKELV